MNARESKDAFWLEWMSAGIALLQPNAPKLTFDRASRAARRAMARAAVTADEGNISAAAARLETSRRSIHRALNDRAVAPSADLSDTLGMYPDTPLNDELFPLIRVRWPATPDAEWANSALDWFIANVYPRALEEQTKVVNIHDYSAITSGLPMGPISVATARAAEVNAAGAATATLGVIIFSPHTTLANYWAPVINMFPFSTKFATTPAQVLALAQAAFDDAGISVPALSLD